MEVSFDKPHVMMYLEGKKMGMEMRGEDIEVITEIIEHFKNMKEPQ